MKVKDLYLYQSDKTFTARSIPPDRDERPNSHSVQPITVTPTTAKERADSLWESSADPTEGRIIAYLIASEVLGADICFALDDSFNPDDGLAIFYADELEFLKNKDAQTLRKIYETKLAFGPGSRVKQ